MPRDRITLKLPEIPSILKVSPYVLLAYVVLAADFWLLRVFYWHLVEIVPFSDMADYFHIANGIRNSFDFSHSPFWQSYKPPSVPLMMALVFTIAGGTSVAAWQLAQTLLLFTGLCWLLREMYLATRSHLLCLALFLAVAHAQSSIFWSAKPATESVAEAMIYLSAAASMRAWRRQSIVSYGVLGAILLTGVLARPNFLLPMAAVLGIFVLRAVLHPGAGGGRWSLYRLAALFGVIILLWSPWLLRSVRLYGAVVSISTQGPYTLLWEVGEVTIRGDDGSSITKTWKQLQAEASQEFANDYEAMRYASRFATQWLRENRLRLPAIMVQRARSQLSNHDVHLTKVPRDRLYDSALDVLLLDPLSWVSLLGIIGLIVFPAAVSGAVWFLPLIGLGSWAFTLPLLSYARMVEPLLPLLAFGNLALLWSAARFLTSRLAARHPPKGRTLAPQQQVPWEQGLSGADRYKVPLNQNTLGDVELEGVQRVLASGRFTMGPVCAAFEEEFAAYLGESNAVMVNSGSSANLLAFFCLANPLFQAPSGYRRWQPGAEVIVPAVTWSTTIWPIVQAGGVPVLVDSDPETLQMRPEAVREAIADRTVAICAVHILGNAAPIQELTAIAQEHGLFVIEDTCEALGVRTHDRYVGTFGLIGTFSFFFSHHMTTIEGGMLVTEDDRSADLLRALRAHGWTRQMRKPAQFGPFNADLDSRFLFVTTGFNVRPTELNAELGRHQLARLAGFNEQRRTHSEEMKRQLANGPAKDRIAPMRVRNGITPAFFGFPVLCESTKVRNGLREWLEKAGIETRPIVCGNMARQPAMQYLAHRVSGTLAGADAIMDRGLYWGLHPLMSAEDISYITETVNHFFLQ